MPATKTLKTASRLSSLSRAFPLKRATHVWGGPGEAKDSRGTPHRGPLSSGEPNRETTAERDPLRRHAHSFAAAALSYYPSTRLHLVMATNADPVSVSRDSLWWISDPPLNTKSEHQK
jgi:hypothetical protein